MLNVIKHAYSENKIYHHSSGNTPTCMKSMWVYTVISKNLRFGVVIGCFVIIIGGTWRFCSACPSGEPENTTSCCVSIFFRFIVVLFSDDFDRTINIMLLSICEAFIQLLDVCCYQSNLLYVIVSSINQAIVSFCLYCFTFSHVGSVIAGWPFGNRCTHVKGLRWQMYVCVHWKLCSPALIEDHGNLN